MLSLGWQEMVAIFVVALVLFGPKKLPELGRTIGRAMTEFRRATNELKATFDREMQQIDRENESLKQTASSYVNDAYGTHYDSPHYDPDGYRYGSYDSSTASNPEQVSDPASTGAESTSTSAEHGTAVTTAPAEGIIARTTEHASSSDPVPPEAAATGHEQVEHKA